MNFPSDVPSLVLLAGDPAAILRSFGVGPGVDPARPFWFVTDDWRVSMHPDAGVHPMRFAELVRDIRAKHANIDWWNP